MKKKNKGSVVLFVGAPQTGKTTKILEIIKNMSPNGAGVCALDPYGEHIAELHLSEWSDLENLALYTKNKTFIFEEATHYFQSTSSTQGMKKLLTGTMGHFHHNIFLCFHNLKSVPSWVLPSVNYIYYTKTLEKGNVEYPLNKITELGNKGFYRWYNRSFLMG